MKWLKRFMILLVVLYVASMVFDHSIIEHLADKRWLTNYIHQNGIAGSTVILLTSIIFLAISGSKQVIAFMFGLIYPLSMGVGMTIVACMLAALLNYIAAYFFMGEQLVKKYPQKMGQFKRFTHHKPFLKILLLRLFPIGSNVLTNILSGSIRMPLFPFLTASLIGYIPQIFIFVLVGAGVQSSSHAMTYLGGSLAVISFVLTAYIYRDHIQNRFEFNSQGAL